MNELISDKWKGIDFVEYNLARELNLLTTMNFKNVMWVAIEKERIKTLILY